MFIMKAEPVHILPYQFIRLPGKRQNRKDILHVNSVGVNAGKRYLLPMKEGVIIRIKIAAA